MPDETLELSEHELYFLPPGTPATAPATRVEVEVDGEMGVFLARVELREYKDKGRFTCVFYRREEGAEIIVESLDYVESFKSEEKKVRHICKSIQSEWKNRFWRSIDGKFGVIVSLEVTRIFWLIKGRMIDSEVLNPDFLCSMSEVFSWPQHDFVAYFDELYADKDSELNYALRWHETLSQKKDLVAFKCQNGDWDQLRHFLSLTQIIVVHRCGGFPAPYFDRSYGLIDRSWVSSSRNQGAARAKAITWADRWRDVICGIMRPSFWENEPRCVSGWRRRNQKVRDLCTISCGIPTHHEVLEAQIRTARVFASAFVRRRNRSVDAT